ncbi:MAG: DUF368 domain-containing protein [Caldilineaceae bacterium]|nr:DUF368 domain-containing protein [Caldilineaceae bacterium]
MTADSTATPRQDPPPPHADTPTPADFAPDRTLGEYLGLTARGFAMGCADIVPGVSGGTMAFILGIYEELVMSIRAGARRPFWQALLRLNVPTALDAINARFLLSVLAGIAIAVLTLASWLEWVLERHPVLIWSFFFGLVLASIVTVRKRIQNWNAALFTALAAGAVGAYFVVGAVPVQTPDASWFLFLSGMLAICAMILPGISGSFILVLLGKYQFVLAAVNQRDIVSLAIVGAGAVVGIVTFAQLLAWLFKRYHDATIAVLIGLMAGSLRKIWPWKETVASIIDRHGELLPTVQRNHLPAALTGEVFFALGLAVMGFAVVMVLDRLSASK